MQQDEIESFLENETFERCIYESIKSYSGNGKLNVGLSLREIAKRATMNFMTVKRYLPKLINKGMVKIVGSKTRTGGTVKVYQVVTLGVTGGYTSPKLSVTDRSVSVTHSTLSVTEPATKSLQPNNLKPNIKKPLRTKETIKNQGPKSSLPYKALVLLFNKKYSTNLFPTFGKQSGAIKKILQSYGESDIWSCAEWLAKDSFWSLKGFDFGTILSQIGKWKQSQASIKKRDWKSQFDTPEANV